MSGREALLVGYEPAEAWLCRGYRVVARIRMPVDNEERCRPLARCTLLQGLAALWPRLQGPSPTRTP